MTDLARGNSSSLKRVTSYHATSHIASYLFSETAKWFGFGLIDQLTLPFQSFFKGTLTKVFGSSKENFSKHLLKEFP